MTGTDPSLNSQTNAQARRFLAELSGDDRALAERSLSELARNRAKGLQEGAQAPAFELTNIHG